MPSTAFTPVTVALAVFERPEARVKTTAVIPAGGSCGGTWQDNHLSPNYSQRSSVNLRLRFLALVLKRKLADFLYRARS